MTTRPLPLPVVGFAVSLLGIAFTVSAFGDEYPEIRHPYDFGDAPESYGTLLASDGARHTIGLPIFGEIVDSNPDGLPSALANGDDLFDASDDEDGIVWLGALVAGSTVGATAEVIRDSQVVPHVNGWIDFDADGTFDETAERVLTDVPMVLGSNALSLEIPIGAVVGDTYARFRISHEGGDAPTGEGGNGEVEDYLVTIQAPTTVDERTFGGVKSLYFDSRP